MNIDVFNSIIDNINLFLGFLALVIVIIQLLARDKDQSNYIIIIFYSCYSIIITLFSVEISGKMLDYPHLLGISWPFCTLLATTLYLFVRKLKTPSFRILKKHLLIFMPSLIYFILLIPTVYLKSSADKINYLSQYNVFSNISLLNLIFFNGTSFVFTVLCIYELRLFLNLDRIKNIKLFRIVFIIIIIGISGIIFNSIGLFGVIFKSIGLIAENNLILRINSILFNVAVFAPFFLMFRYPDFMQNLSVEISKEKYKQSQINGLNVDSVITRLNELCEIEKIHTEPELNINIVSEQLEITSHQLSEILNDKLQVNFKNYINNHRVQESKELLIEKPEDSILSIAFSAGFNSKTVFNTAFKKNTGITPGEFRKSNL